MRIRTSLLTAVAMLSLSATAAMSDGTTIKPVLTNPVVKPEIKPGVLVGDLVLPTADLVVDSVQYFPQFPNMVRVQVTNKGAVASTPTSLKLLRYVGNQATHTGTPVEAMHPGQSQIVMAQIGGIYDDSTHVYVRVDDPSLVKESNEGNNSYKVK